MYCAFVVVVACASKVAASKNFIILIHIIYMTLLPTHTQFCGAEREGGEYNWQLHSHACSVLAIKTNFLSHIVNINFL